jgi:cellulose synthase/poly-beta-1,6-N-acetylglucosamine synthase-like glycosyltransferase
MEALGWFLFAYQVFVLYYFAVLNFLYTTFTFFGLNMVARYARELSELSLKDLLEREAYLPVSILVPTYNEEKTIAASVRSFLALRYPEFEVIVVADGPKDRTLEVLKEAFALVEVDWVYRRALPTKPIRAVYRSLAHPNLLVVDKENGGKADALNAGLNFARYPPLLRRGRGQPPGPRGPPPGKPPLFGGRTGPGGGGDHPPPERGPGAGGRGGGAPPAPGFPGENADH